MTLLRTTSVETINTSSIGTSTDGTPSTFNKHLNAKTTKDANARQVRRRDSVATSSGSSDRKHGRSDSRRSSTHSTKRPGLARAHTSHGALPRRRTMQEAIEFHRQSVSLFEGAAQARQGPYSAPSSPKRENAVPLVGSLNMMGASTVYSHSPPTTTSRLDSYFELEEEGPSNQIPSTIMHWTSPDTRRRQYAEIDRVHTGLRGFWRKVAPRWLCPRVPAKFYDEKAGDDCCSVRRHRLALPQDSEARSLRNTASRPGISRNLSCF